MASILTEDIGLNWLRDLRELIDIRFEMEVEEERAELMEKDGLDDRGVEMSELAVLYMVELNAIERGDGRCREEKKEDGLDRMWVSGLWLTTRGF